MEELHKLVGEVNWQSVQEDNLAEEFVDWGEGADKEHDKGREDGGEEGVEEYRGVECGWCFGV